MLLIHLGSRTFGRKSVQRRRAQGRGHGARWHGGCPLAPSKVAAMMLEGMPIW